MIEREGRTGFRFNDASVHRGEREIIARD